jgi:hypothetical protein
MNNIKGKSYLDINDELYVFSNDHYSHHDKAVSGRLNAAGYVPAKSRYRRRWEPLTAPIDSAKVEPNINQGDSMTNLQYTDYQYNNTSEIVRGATYNANTRDLAVFLGSESAMRDTDEVYVYQNVPVDLYNSLVDTNQSAGRVYAIEVKRKYGPGRRVGERKSINFERVSKSGIALSDVSSANAHTITLNLGTSRDKALVNSAAFVDSSEARSTTVYFEVNGQTKTHNSKYASVDAAVAAVEEFAEALGLSVTVTEVTVHFV